ncbi:MAG: hypothetical protein LBB54_04400 [Cellulomonadaceae bacterium]|jgi:hypothetical protein|nr:hypothetical protein [Cellulomonadaceae bacterium]
MNGETFQMSPMSSAPLLTIDQWTETVGASRDSYYRWRKAGLLDGVAVVVDEKVFIPADTPRPTAAEIKAAKTSGVGGPDELSRGVARHGTTPARDMSAVTVAGVGAGLSLTPAPTPAAAIGGLLPLEVTAALLGTTVGGVRRMGAAGLFTVGKFGPHGAWRVFIPPTSAGAGR